MLGTWPDSFTKQGLDPNSLVPRPEKDMKKKEGKKASRKKEKGFEKGVTVIAHQDLVALRDKVDLSNLIFSVFSGPILPASLVLFARHIASVYGGN